MCGRYSLFTEQQAGQRLVDMVNRLNQEHPNPPIKTGEIFPTNVAPVLIVTDDTLQPVAFGWGFPNFRNKGVIINARADTAPIKPMFKGSLAQRRCVIPSTGFYEWAQDGSKQKYLFRIPDENILYMAGIYNEFNDEKRFVMLTTDANESVKNIHHRMPVVLPENQIDQWVYDTDAALDILQAEPPQLAKTPV